jgi:ribosome-binding factor A
MSESHRIEKINSLVQNIVAQAIARDFCPPAQTIVSLTKVSASGNLQEAKVYISVLPDRQRAPVVAQLERNVAFFQDILNKKMRTRPVPKIIFVPDANPAQAQEVEVILEQLKKS